jgi:hypothetical protein
LTDRQLSDPWHEFLADAEPMLAVVVAVLQAAETAYAKQAATDLINWAIVGWVGPEWVVVAALPAAA